MATLKTVLHSKTNSKKEKIHRLAIRVTALRKANYLYLGYTIDPKDWDKHSEKIKKSHPKHSQLNRLIRKKYDQLEDVIYEVKAQKEKLSAKQIIDSIKEDSSGKNFFDFVNEHLDHLKKLGKHNRAISDNSKANRVREYVGSNELDFERIDKAMLKKLKIYLMAGGKTSERTVMNIFGFIRLMYNVAIEEGAADPRLYPFGKGQGKIQIKYPDSKKIGLNKTEILSIEQLELEPNSTIWHTKNIFLFSFYLAGIRASDALKIKWKDIIDDRLYYKMGKNDKADSLQLPDKAVAILNLYRKDLKITKGFIFPFLEGVNEKNSKALYSRVKTNIKKINNYLKQIGEKAKIDKKITSHIARHSFGQIAGDKVSPQKLQKLYRHSHLNTTIGYQSNFDHKQTDEALNNVLDF